MGGRVEGKPSPRAPTIKEDTMTRNGTVGREVLPIPDRRLEQLVAYDAKDPATAFPPIEPLRPPVGAPNVLLVLLDDVGFGAPCATPTAERLAANGLSYNRFHTTALCAPTRQALLTGRNHHSVGMGGIPEIATSAPGYSSIRPNTAAPLAETLKLNGYSTAQFGKCHEVPVWETSPMGPLCAGALPRHGAGRARPHARAGLPLHRGHDRPGDPVDPPTEGADARQAVLRLLRAGRQARAARCLRSAFARRSGRKRPTGRARPRSTPP
jgi:hypothetical protein